MYLLKKVFIIKAYDKYNIKGGENMLAASELLKALKEDENIETHKDSNDDYDFGKVLDLYNDTNQP